MNEKCSGAHGAEIVWVNGRKVVVAAPREAMCPVCFPGIAAVARAARKAA